MGHAFAFVYPDITHFDHLILMPRQVPARGISQMWKKRVQAGTRLPVAQFVVDAAVLLLDRPHHLHVDAAQRLPAVGKPEARRDIVARIQQHQC